MFLARSPALHNAHHSCARRRDPPTAALRSTVTPAIYSACMSKAASTWRLGNGHDSTVSTNAMPRRLSRVGKIFDDARCMTVVAVVAMCMLSIVERPSCEEVRGPYSRATSQALYKGRAGSGADRPCLVAEDGVEYQTTYYCRPARDSSFNSTLDRSQTLHCRASPRPRSLRETDSVLHQARSCYHFQPYPAPRTAPYEPVS